MPDRHQPGDRLTILETTMSQQVIPTLNEHAGRIRGIEKYIWIAFGGLGVLGSVVSVIVAFFKH